MVEKYSKIILGLILLASLVLRTYGLQTSPPSLYWDEMDVGYQAYSILKTGKDYFGETPLLTIHSFADFRAPLSIYLTIPFVWIMGLSAWSVRLPSAIMGVISVLLVYILSEIFFKNKKLSLLAALLVAVAPWNIQYSRIAFEATLMLMLSLFLGGLICFFKGLERPRWFVLSALLFSLSLFAYNTAKLFVPLVIVLLIAIYIRKKALTKITWISLGIFAVEIGRASCRERV